MSIEDQALQKFGELLMRRVRDPSIRDADRVLDGVPSQSKYMEWLHKWVVSALGIGGQEAVRYLIPYIVDHVLHHLLWCLDQVAWVNVSVEVDGEVVPTLRGMSDGMVYDCYDWIRELSTERHEYLEDRDRMAS